MSLDRAEPGRNDRPDRVINNFQASEQTENMANERASDGTNDLSHALTARTAGRLSGRVNVPGDKSISHRALMFTAMATGSARISGLLEADDVLNTAAAMRALGASVTRDGDDWVVKGCGTGGLCQPSGAIDYGNAGTGTRLLMGAIAGHDMTVTLTGDASLSRRPMGRVLNPLKTMGLQVLDGDRETLPLTIKGTRCLVPIEYPLPVASAQVKSAVMIAGLLARGQTTVIEAEKTRDHTERMLSYLGADVRAETVNGKTAITVQGEGELVGRPIQVPGDPSSAAFLVAAAVMVPGSDVTVEGVLINETRTGFYLTLQEMGADLSFTNQRVEGGESVADLRVKGSDLTGVTVPASRAPSMIDEYPVLAVVASRARGETRMQALHELRVKESDRLRATADGLSANGVAVQIENDDLIVTGAPAVRGGGLVTTHLDHRIAMAFLILGLVSERPVAIDDQRMIATSFKEFTAIMSEIGVEFAPVDPKDFASATTGTRP